MSKKEIDKLFKEFEEKFGFKSYEKIKLIYSRTYQKIDELTKARENWKEKYYQLKENRNIYKD